MVNLHKRLLLAFLVAVILACVLGIAEARQVDGEDDPGRIVVYYPGICIVLTPGTYWHRYFKCEDVVGGLQSETVATLETADTLTTHIERVHPDGSVTRLWRVQRKKEN